MSRPKWIRLDTARWECNDPDDDTWGGYGGESEASNLRRTKAAAREHREETGHSTTVMVVRGFWE